MRAVFSACGAYRFRLDRDLGGLLPGPVTGFCLHNPSRAGDEVDDPTSTRGIGYATAWGASRLIYVNPWAGIATRPTDLWQLPDPVGADNDHHILLAAVEVQRSGGFMVAAWGTIKPPVALRADARARLRHVEALIRSTGCPLKALVVNADGSPKHPLYVRADARPQPWSAT